MPDLTFRVEEVSTGSYRVLLTHDTTDTPVTDAYSTADAAAGAFVDAIYPNARWDTSLWNVGRWRDPE